MAGVNQPPAAESWPAFDWADPLLVEQELTAEERQVRDSARAFAERQLRPLVGEGHRSERASRSLSLAFGQAGLFGATLPGAGGAGISDTAYGLVAREVERIDSAYRSLLSVQSSLVMQPIHSFGTAAQQREWLPRLASGEWIGSFGLTEPDAGSDPASLRTHAERTPAGFVLNGAKTWITSAPFADLLIIWAKCDLQDGAGERLRGFVVLRGDPGLETPPIEGKWALRSWPTGEVFLRDVHLPPDRLLPGALGLKAPFSCLNHARFGIGWGVLGAAEACWETGRDYVLARRQFGRPLAATQLVQKKLAFMQTEITLGLLLALRCGRLLERGQLAPEAISLLKRNNAGKALEIARMARDMLGANGISDAYPIMRHLMNLEAVNTYEGTADIHALVLGRAQTGLAAFQ